MTLITFQQVSKEFTHGTKAVSELSFTIEPGEFFVLIGPSGCGKTTTLKMINRLIEPSSGVIKIKGTNAAEANINELRWSIGYVLQQIALFPHMTVSENIAVVPEMKKWKQTEISTRVDELLELVGMEPKLYRDRLPSDLSGGQQQRVGVARALAADPDILLMDEPFSALDPLVREQLQHDIKELQQKIKKTIVFVTHDMNEAAKLGDRIGMMENGEIIQIGTVKELQKNPASPSVSDFINRASDRKTFKLADAVVPLQESAYVHSEIHLEQHELQFSVNPNDELSQACYQGKIISSPITIPSTSTIREAFDVLEEQNLPAVPVQEKGKMIGVISYQALARLTVQ